MSRVAKMPVTIPAGVDVTMNEQHISVKGAGGQLSIANNALVKVIRQGESMTFEAADESREACYEWHLAPVGQQHGGWCHQRL